MEDGVKLPKYFPLFEKEEANLYSLIFDLDEEGLDDIGITNRLHRKRFLRVRDKLMGDNKEVSSLFLFFFFFFCNIQLINSLSIG